MHSSINMNKFFYAISIALCLFSSCSKSDDEIIDSALNGLIGKVPYESIIWQGEAIDFVGDGVITKDVMKGFEGKSNAEIVFSRGVYVNRPVALNSPTAILVSIPVQSVIFNKIIKSYDWMNPYALIAHMTLFYEVDKNGNFSFDVSPFLDDVNDYVEENEFELRCPDMQNTVNGEIISMRDGVIQIKITACYLDWSKGELVSNEIIITCHNR